MKFYRVQLQSPTWEAPYSTWYTSKGVAVKEARAFSASTYIDWEVWVDEVDVSPSKEGIRKALIYGMESRFESLLDSILLRHKAAGKLTLAQVSG